MGKYTRVAVLSAFKLVGSFITFTKGDPCSSSVYKLPHLNARYKYYINTESYHQDSALFPGWYSVGELTMLDEPPDDIFDCGTKFPLWLNGNHPEQVNEEVNRKVCVVDHADYCESEYDIKIKKCPGDTFVYQLSATPAGSGYCFGSVPSFQPLIGELVHGIETVPLGRISSTRAYFECKFTGSNTEELFYRVAWYQDGYQMLLSDFGNSSSDPVYKLTEEMFVDNGMQLGHTLSCDVEAYTVENGSPGPRSDKSAGYFAGIKVLTPTLNFVTNEKNDSKRTILLQPTVPIGCVGEQNCKIELLATIPEDSELGVCNGISLDFARCGTEIAAANVVDTEVKLVLHTVETGQYKIDRQARVYLKVADHRENLIWPNYSLEPISIYLTANGEGDLSDGKRCQSNNDPHMYTFDMKSYELQPDKYSEAVYTLFKNELFNAEVQIQIIRCNLPWNAYCNCGVAVKSGQDIYTISTCNGILNMKYTNCADGFLKVKSLGTKTYQIYLPYGAYVQVGLESWEGWSSGLFMHIHVYPSTLDEGNTRGLCGTLDDDPKNDFHDEKGFEVAEESFVETWRVKSDANNMLHTGFDMSSLIPYEQGVCICPEHDGTGQVPPLRPVSCDKNAVASCSKGKAVSIHDCPDIIRTRRSVDGRPKVPAVIISTNNQHARYKRASESQTWTQETAEAFCRDFMRENPVYELCETVPNAEPQIAVFDCISDIMLTGGTDWAIVSRRTMQSACGTELTRNMTLRMSEYNKPSVAATIERILCNNECSGIGTCTDGVCECPASYGGSDCSIDLTIPPTMHGLLDDGLCDEREYPCTHAYCFAYPVSDSSGLTCRLEEFYISRTKERISLATYTTVADFSTLGEALCPLEGFRKRRSSVTSNDAFISGYIVSISNDGGVMYSEGHDLFIFDSSCVLVEETGGDISFVLLEGFCLIDRQCVFDGTIAANDNCSICDTTRSVSSWSTNIAMNECPDEMSQSTTTVQLTTKHTSAPVTLPMNTTIVASNIKTSHDPVSSQTSTTIQAALSTVTTQETDKPDGAKQYLWIIGVIVPVVLLIVAVVIYIIKKKSKTPTATLTPIARQPTGISMTSATDIWIVTKTAIRFPLSDDKGPPSYQESCGISNSNVETSLPPADNLWNK